MMEGEPSSSTQEWDLEKLQHELQRQTEIRDGLLRTTTQMQQAVQDAEKIIENFPNEDCVWREHYLKQRAHNQQLEAQLNQLERKLADLKSEIQNVSEQEAGTTYEGLSEVSMRQLLKRLVKEKAELEWQLRESEWRLDQESTAVCKAEEEKKDILTKLGQASLELEKTRSTHRRIQVSVPKKKETNGNSSVTEQDAN